MAPRHTQGCGGAACLATALFLVPQTKNWCAGFSFPPPAYAGIHPTLYLFGFQANALNSHSPPSLPGFDLGLVSDDAFRDLFGALFGDNLRGLRGPPAAFDGCWWVLRFFALRGPPGASGGLRGLRGPLGQASGGLGFGSGFPFWASLP